MVNIVDSWEFLTQRYNLEEDGKLAIDFLVRDIRQMDIDSSGNPDINSASSSALNFVDSNNETIIYNFSGNTIYKNNQPLVRGVSSFEIKYYAQNNKEISPSVGAQLTPGEIRQIWFLYVRFVLTQGGENAVYSSYIFPRNFLAR